jgi:CheY-like chemotaxis protein
MILTRRSHRLSFSMSACIEKTIFLLVEDDPHDVFVVEREFKHRGLAGLRVVHDGIEAMRYLEGKGDYQDRIKSPLPDVILLDLKMPRFSGFDFLEWLRGRAPGQLHLIPVVVLSSSDDPHDVKRAYALGVNSYIVKPLRWPELQDKMRALSIYWSEHVETPVVM